MLVGRGALCAVGLEPPFDTCSLPGLVLLDVELAWVFTGIRCGLGAKWMFQGVRCCFFRVYGSVVQRIVFAERTCRRRVTSLG